MRSNPDNAPEKKAEYKATLAAMSEVELFKETKDKIWFSAFAANNPRSCYHWQCDATHAEWARRSSSGYSVAHRAAMRREGFGVPESDEDRQFVAGLSAEIHAALAAQGEDAG